MATYFTTPCAMSGTPPPCLSSSSSLAKASRISACRRESLTSFFSSSKETTKYSIFASLAASLYPTQRFLPYLISPQQLVPLLALRSVPYGQQLLQPCQSHT